MLTQDDVEGDGDADEHALVADALVDTDSETVALADDVDSVSDGDGAADAPLVDDARCVPSMEYSGDDDIAGDAGGDTLASADTTVGLADDEDDASALELTHND